MKELTQLENPMSDMFATLTVGCTRPANTCDTEHPTVKYYANIMSFTDILCLLIWLGYY